MKYYTIDNSIIKKEVGFQFQTSGFIDVESAQGPNSRVNMEYDKNPSFTPDLRFELHEKSKLTDVVDASNISARGFLMNTKTKNILEQCRLFGYKFYDASVLDHDGIVNPYFWMHIISNDYDIIDFKQSVFRVHKFPILLKSDKIEEMPTIFIKDKKDYERKKNELFFEDKYLVIDVLKIVDTNHFDMIHFGNIDINTVFISEKLANLLKKEKITGITITPTDKLVNLADE